MTVILAAIAVVFAGAIVVWRRLNAVRVPQADDLSRVTSRATLARLEALVQAGQNSSTGRR